MWRYNNAWNGARLWLRQPRCLRAVVLALMLGSATGCVGTQCRDCGGCHGECVGQLPDPRGAHTQAIFELHAGKAEADDFVIYQNEWAQGGDQLGPCGRRHVETIARRLLHETFPVVVEPSGDAELDDSRRMQVLKELADHGVVDIESRVTIGYPEAEGLSDVDAARVVEKLFSSQRQQSEQQQLGPPSNFGPNSARQTR